MDFAKFLGSISLLDKLYDKVIEFSFTLLHSEISLLLGVEPELEKLKRTSARIHALLRDAEERRHIEDDVVKLWLRDLRDVVLDADDLLDEVETRRTIFQLRDTSAGRRTRKRSWFSAFLSPPSPDILFRRRLGKEIVEIRERLEEIAGDRERLRPRTGDAPRRAQAPDPPPSAAIFADETRVLGRDDDLTRIVDLLVEDGAPAPHGNSGLPVIPIYGMAGTGKTTLAKYVFNNGSVVQRFGAKRIWVCATRGFAVERITREILECLTGEPCRLSNFNLLHCRARERLGGDPFLLVLDDVREEVLQYWDSLRACLPAGGGQSRVLITTRREDVARRIGTGQLERLGGLSEDDCFNLLSWRAFPNGGLELEQHAVLRGFGMEIARKCQGSPLAAISFGGLLYLQTHEAEWRSILTEMPEFPQGDADILPKLMVTYEHLPLHLKKCFAYCSIFPEGYLFDKDELVRLWMAEGFVDRRGGRRLESIGDRYFDELVWISFFQISDASLNQKLKYKMPNLIHDLAKSVSIHECFRLEHGAIQPRDVSKKARHSLLFCHSGESIKFAGFYEYSKLRTLVLKGEARICIGRLPSDLFLKLRCLRVLDLCDCKLIELPDSIGELTHLRYLGLYRTLIERLPESLTSLYNLQTLELSECFNLIELPKDISSLINLRYLGLNLDRHTSSNLMSMPPGIGRLTSLQTLSRFVVGRKRGCGIGELKNLNLRGKLCISRLEDVVSLENAREANLQNKNYLRSLTLQWSDNNQPNVQHEGWVDVIECLHPPPYLNHLCIDNYDGLTVPSWIDGTSFSKLVTLRLSYCKRWKFLPSLRRQPALKELFIEGMHEVQSMDLMLSNDGTAVTFPSLVKLTLWDLPSLNTLSLSEGEIPHLSELYVSHCPKLMDIPHLPSSVTKFVIKHCLELSSLPALPLLQDLTVEACHWKVLAKVNNLTSLLSLTISHIPTLKFLQEGILQPLTSLKRLEIKGCKRLVSVAGNEGLQDFGSLEHLEISSCPTLAAISTNGLPANLKICRLCYCYKLRSLPRGLHNLQSLQHMEIRGIPWVISLPEEGLPPPLQYLAISGCPLLGRRCRKDQGEDWPKIQHISSVEIDFQEIVSRG